MIPDNLERVQSTEKRTSLCDTKIERGNSFQARVSQAAFCHLRNLRIDSTVIQCPRSLNIRPKVAVNDHITTGNYATIRVAPPRIDVVLNSSGHGESSAAHIFFQS